MNRRLLANISSSLGTLAIAIINYTNPDTRFVTKWLLIVIGIKLLYEFFRLLWKKKQEKKSENQKTT